LATFISIFSNLAKNYSERAYLRNARLVSMKKDRVPGEKNEREKDLMEGLRRVQKQIRGS